MDTRFVPDGATETFLPYGGGHLRVLRGGPEPDLGADGRVPLVLVHGGGSDNASISWSGVFAPLATTRSVIAFDLPGFGLTTGIGVDGHPTAMADLTARVTAELGVERAVFVGVSMGGDVVLNVGLRHPALVAGLVLIAPGGLTRRLGGPVVQAAAWLAAQLPDRVLFGLARLANRFTAQALRRMVHDPSTIPAPVLDAFVAEAVRPDAAVGYARYNQATLGLRGMANDVLPVVSQITAPALFVHGAEDRLVSPSDSVAAAQAMPDAHLVLVADCGHWVQVERPHAFLDALADFLTRVDAPSDPHCTDVD